MIQISKPTEEAVKTEVLEAVKSALGRLLPRRMTSSSESSDLGSVPEEVANRAAGPSQAELAEEAVKEVCVYPAAGQKLVMVALKILLTSWLKQVREKRSHGHVCAPRLTWAYCRR